MSDGMSPDQRKPLADQGPVAAPAFLWIEPEGTLPEAPALAPFRAVIVIDADTSPAWREAVSDWLVGAGCLYAMAWGANSSAWDDAIDMANLRRFDFETIPSDRFVMTTWHDDEPLVETFQFCKQCALHPSVDLTDTLLLHVSRESRELELIQAYALA